MVYGVDCGAGSVVMVVVAVWWLREFDIYCRLGGWDSHIPPFFPCPVHIAWCWRRRWGRRRR
ncbi:hypothetical protein E2C01_051145 [Portunus trituberculatus]|uniref:Uncharacterized protein n=1 Tax=Portunus trituberculatus TaxID=210409 RepID=A0A5B7GA72_PORTR|nr:hypothetical protein [Portunus trituberculatus]